MDAKKQCLSNGKTSKAKEKYFLYVDRDLEDYDTKEELESAIASYVDEECDVDRVFRGVELEFKTTTTVKVVE